MHATFRAAMRRDKLLKRADKLQVTTTSPVDLAERHTAIVIGIGACHGPHRL